MTSKQLEKLNRLVEINSYTQNKVGVNAVGEQMLEFLNPYGFNWKVHTDPKKGNLFVGKPAHWNESSPVILLNGHLDTVFPENWPVRIEGDKYIGPGGMDMKAGLVEILEVVERLHQSGCLQNIMLLFSPDEEDGFAHIEKQKEYYAQADYALVFEEGTRDSNNPNPKERALITSRKALNFFEVEFSGVAGHNAKLESARDRHSAIHEAAERVMELEALNNYEAGTLINVGLISGGTSANAIAAKASLKVDVRYGNSKEYERVKPLVEAVLRRESTRGVQVSFEEVLGYPAFDKNPRTEALAKTVQNLGQELELDITLQDRSSGSEANSIATYNPNCTVLDGFGVVGAGDHSEEEFFFLSSFEPGVNLALRTIEHIQNSASPS